METREGPTPDTTTQRGFAVHSIKSKADARRTPSERFADWMTTVFGSVAFLALNALVFIAWIAINMGWVPAVQPFDPFPFGLLTMLVSLEAIFLAIIVLISQNRAAHVADVREEIDLHINRITEAEATQILKMMALLLDKQGIPMSNNPEIMRMLRPLRDSQIERSVEEQTTRKSSLTNTPKQ